MNPFPNPSSVFQHQGDTGIYLSWRGHQVNTLNLLQPASRKGTFWNLNWKYKQMYSMIVATTSLRKYYFSTEEPLYVFWSSSCTYVFLRHSFRLYIRFSLNMSAAVFHPAAVHNGWFVPISRSSSRLLMSRCLRAESYTAAFYSWHCLVFSLPVKSNFPWRPEAWRTTSALNAESIICLLWSAACPGLLTLARAPFSHVETPLSSPMFTEPLSDPLRSEDGVKWGWKPSRVPVPLPLCGCLLVYPGRRVFREEN